MIIKREFFTVKAGKMMSDKAFEKALPALIKRFECDAIASACYIGDGVYTVICTTSDKTELDPQGQVHNAH